ncbi:agamous-like MADS-box protein AGL80 [Macadamia integrifolia]|uniref:agamous-like MADS-box protein AGL80 n=1 Tax=Macadamia integrifolia TaxID=60698 RepID=UPI001C52A366|nr:agamous-like MADS-box protein AGL80 [Macadamia integrifolia]
MARKKVKLAWIQNDSARRATFKKRKRGIMKKVSELSTLCGVSACAIIYGPYEPEPDVWPSPPEAKRVLARFRNMPDMEQCKKMLNQEEFLRQRISKAKEHVKKYSKDNREKENTKLLFECLAGQKGLHDLGLETLTDIVWIAESKLKTMKDRMGLLNRPSTIHSPLPTLSDPPPQYFMTMSTPNLNPTPNLTPTPNPMDIHHHDHHRMMMMRNNNPAANANAVTIAATNAVGAPREVIRNNVGGGEQNRMAAIDHHQVAAMEALHVGHQLTPTNWFMDMNMMNPNEQVGFPPNEMVLQYVDNNNIWTNPFFP